MYRWGWLCLVFLFVPSFAMGDRVTFRNGDVVSGNVVAWKDGKFEIKSALIGDINAPWNAVSSIQAEHPLVIVVGDRALRCESMTVSDDGVQLNGPKCENIFIDKKSLQSIEAESVRKEDEKLEHANIASLWTGNFDAGLSAARSNAANSNVNVGMNAARATNSDRISVSTTVLHSRTRTEIESVNTTAIRAAARYARNLGPQLFAFGFGNFETDELQNLDLRRVLGTGLGYRLAPTKTLRLDVFSGGSFLQESFALQPTRSAGEMLFGQEVRYKPGRTELAETVSLYPNLTDAGEYRVSLDSSLSVSLNSWLSWRTTLSNIYISNPPLTNPANSFLASTGFRVTLGKEHTFKPSAKIVGY